MDYDETLIDSGPGWRRYLEILRLRFSDDPDEMEALERRLCRGWCIADKDFKQGVAKEMFGKNEAIRLECDELDEFNQVCWEAALTACLARLGTGEDEAAQCKFSERWKLAIASKLKRETSVTNAWLAQRLSMGVPNSVSNLCGVYRRNAEPRCTYAKKLKNVKYER
jgi:hypothetical protein